MSWLDGGNGLDTKMKLKYERGWSYLQAVLGDSAWTTEERLHLILRNEALVDHARTALSGVDARMRGHVGCERAPRDV